jgi:hypothetical protein
VFEDDGGADVYECGPSGTLGDPCQGSDRPGMSAYGLFLDLGGDARFPADHPRARAGTTWVIPGSGEHATAVGVGRAQ